MDTKTAIKNLKSIPDVSTLEELLSEPTEKVIESLKQIEGDIMFLGVAGKMGPTISRMAKRASQIADTKRKIIGVSRFSNPLEQAQLERHGINTIKCDLLDSHSLESLPDVPNIVYMAGLKFGSAGNESMTWAMNCFLPGMVCKKFHSSRIVAFSTGCVYGMVSLDSGGSNETDVPIPEGEYSMSCLGRERIFEHFSKKNNTPVSIIRLNYATEMRYGVLVDIAEKVRNGDKIDLSMGYLNAIWQADGNAMSLCSMNNASSPPFVVNVAGPEILSVRKTAIRFAELMKKEVQFSGIEAPDAFLSNGENGYRLFGYPRVNADKMIEWIANWILNNKGTLGKPTYFEVRDGRY